MIRLCATGSIDLFLPSAPRDSTHQPTDTPEKLDYQRLAAIVGATAVVLADVAELRRS